MSEMRFKFSNIIFGLILAVISVLLFTPSSFFASAEKATILSGSNVIIDRDYSPYYVNGMPIDFDDPFGWVGAPESWAGLVYTKHDMYGYPDSANIQDWTSTSNDSCSINPYKIPELNEEGDALQVFAVTQSFTKNNDTWSADVNETVNVTFVEVIMKVSCGDGVPEGWFSITYNESDFFPATPWLVNNRIYDNSGAGVDSGGWFNSSLVPYYEYPFPFTAKEVTYRWNVTGLYDWNYSMMVSSSLFVMWTTKLNYTYNEPSICYLGLTWYYNYDFIDDDYDYIGPIIDDDVPTRDFSTDFTSIIWLIMIFIPAIAMGNFIPRIGYAIGMILMLIVFGVTQSGFLPVTIIGFIGIAIMFYKGD